MQRVSLVVMALAILGLINLAPTSAKAEVPANIGVELETPQDQELDLHFSLFDFEAEASGEVDDYRTSSMLDGQVGYWFEDLPWFGFVPKAPLVEMERKDLDISIDADTNFDPLSSFLLFRYTDGQLQPYIAIGPNLFISDLSNARVDALQRIFMGVSYRF